MKLFTVYWLDGHMNQLVGNTIEEAFGRYYGAGAVAAVDLYEEGCEVNYRWMPAHDEFPGSWTLITPLDIEHNEFSALTIEALTTLLDTYKFLCTEKDEVRYCIRFGVLELDHYGVVKALVIRKSRNSEILGTWLFSPDTIDKALNSYRSLAVDGKSIVDCSDLEMIASEQKFML